jgi:hypothetical protein
MNIPEEDRPVAFLRVCMKRHSTVKQIAAWLRKQADYIEAHETECSKYLTTRLFATKTKHIRQQVQLSDSGRKLMGKHGPR